MFNRPAPEGYHHVTPYLLVADVGEQLDFLLNALGAEEIMRQELDDGTVNHAEVKLGDSRVMMGRAQASYPPMPAMLYVYVDDVDVAFARAVKGGATAVREPQDEPYGDRAAGVADPAGNQWWLASAGRRE